MPKFVTISLLITLVAGCAPPAVKTTALIPAKAHEASLLKEVAVLPFEGPDGKRFAAEIEGVLAGINIGGRQYFSLVERTKIDRIIEEWRFSQSALMDEKTAARVGRLVGARGIYTGTISLSHSTDNYYTEDRTRCAQEVAKKDYRGREIKECVRWEKYKVSCTSRVASFAATPRLLDVDTGRIVYANNISAKESASACSDSQKPLPSHAELIGQAKQASLEQFRRDIAPYHVTMTVKLMDSRHGLTSKEARDRWKQGLNFAKNDRLDRACELWGEIRTLGEESLSLLYNLGVCSETTGDLDQALDLYRRADRLTTGPDERITAALSRVSRALQDRSRLKDQLGR